MPLRIVVTGLLLAGCGPRPVVESPGEPPGTEPPAAAGTMPSSEAQAAGVLPAGLYFRNGYLRGIGREEGLADATHAVTLGPLPDAAAVNELLATTDLGPLPAGYPLVVHSDELGLLDESQRGVMVVLGLFAGKMRAEAWRAGRDDVGARVEALADFETAFERSFGEEEDGADHVGPWFHVVRIAPEGPVPAYAREAIDRAEEAHFNWDVEENRGPDPLARPPEPPLCTAEPGEVFLVGHEEMIGGYYRWAPVRCGDEPAYVPWRATTLFTLVLPREDGGWRTIQVGDVACDVACFCEWDLDASGARLVEGTLEAGCDCPPSCGGGGCS